MDKSSNKQLQTHYNAMWESAYSAAACGDLDYDNHLTIGSDFRRGLTLIARPNQALRGRFESLLDRLTGLEPKQYRYPADDMHVTILSLITVMENPAPQFLRLADYCTSVRTALHSIEAFEIDFYGITMSRGAVIAQGFPRSPALETLRARLRSELGEKDLGASLDQRYRLVTAHLTLLRFTFPLQETQRFSALLEELRYEPLGCMVVNEVELMKNDWYMSSKSVEQVDRIPLQQAILGGSLETF